jgi:K+/H+ antiporter YhaU regulatory subunit KhtT
MRVIPIENKQGLVRDMNSKAVLNTNRKTVEEYHLKTRAMSSVKKQADEIEMMKHQLNELSTLKNDFIEIKNMLSTILNK